MNAHVKILALLAVLAVVAVTLAMRTAHAGTAQGVPTKDGTCSPGAACPFGPPPVVAPVVHRPRIRRTDFEGHRWTRTTAHDDCYGTYDVGGMPDYRRLLRSMPLRFRAACRQGKRDVDYMG